MPDFGVSIPVSGHKTADKFARGLLNIGKAAMKFGNQSKSAFDKASRSGSRFGDIVKGVIAADAIKSAIRKIWEFGKGAIGLASDLTEVQNVVDTTFGGMNKAINKWARNAITKFGLSELEAKKFTGALGAMIKSSGISGDNLFKMSTGLTGLVGDFASFYNLRIDEAFEKVKAAMAGSTEPMLALGINMQVANLEAFALSKGITKSWKSMTQAEKTMLRYNFLMEKSKDAQGDFNKTLGTSFANQQRVFMTKLKQASASLVSKLLPALINAFKYLNKAIDSIDIDKFATALTSIVPVIKFIIKAFVFLLKIIQKTVIIWAPLVSGLIAYIMAMKVFMAIAAVGRFLRLVRIFFLMARAKGILTAAQWALNAAMSANPIGLVIAGIAALITFAVILYKKWDTVKSKFMEWTKIFDNPIFAAIATILLPFVSIPILIARNWDKVVAAVSKAIRFIKSGISSVKSFFGFGGQPPQSPAAPNQREAEARTTNVNVKTDVNVTGPPGTRANVRTRAARKPNMRVAGQN